ncbi:hypothetical protein AVEN_247944-1 [Araneus ventricosus]|uniref:Uncharacterized protein n=1 Tax=Araneus ventricosus TaxID=182803 RepID=A0A4Y2CI29_ARAVE|nr:hypothetical protein AVEN_247944-1 [Araneus ventricosus]
MDRVHSNSEPSISQIAQSSEIEEYNQENTQDWIECEVDDHGYQVVVDGEIIGNVMDDQDPCMTRTA